MKVFLSSSIFFSFLFLCFKIFIEEVFTSFVSNHFLSPSFKGICKRGCGYRSCNQKEDHKWRKGDTEKEGSGSEGLDLGRYKEEGCYKMDQYIPAFQTVP